MKTQFEKGDEVFIREGDGKVNYDGYGCIATQDVLAVNKGMKERMIDFCSRHCISTNEGIEECIEIFDEAVKEIKPKGDDK